MDLLNQMIQDAAKNAAQTKVSFNKVLMEAIQERETMSYNEVLKLNIQFRLKKKYDEELTDEVVTKRADEIRKFIQRAKKQLRGTISNAQDIGGFNFWSKSKGHDVLIEWDENKNIKLIK